MSKSPKLKPWKKPLRAQDILFDALLVFAVAVFIVIIYAVAIGPYSLCVETIELELPGESCVRFALIADLHLTSEYAAEHAKHAAEEIAELSPDYIIIDGDIIDSEETGLKYVDVLNEFPANKTIVTLGNHEYGWAAENETLANEFSDWLVDNGFILLRNENMRIERDEGDICLIGVDSLWSGNADLDKAYAGVSNCTEILISHNPDIMWELGNYSPDITLSGHTHGTQVCVPVINWGFSPSNITENCSRGEYEIEGNRLYITRGLGSTYPIRFNSNPEITIIDAC